METGFEVQLGCTGESNAKHNYRKAKILLGSEAEDGPLVHQDDNACGSEAEDDPPAHQGANACGCTLVCTCSRQGTAPPNQQESRAVQSQWYMRLHRPRRNQLAALAPAPGKFSFGSRRSRWRGTDWKWKWERFFAEGGRKVTWNPIRVLSAPDLQKLEHTWNGSTSKQGPHSRKSRCGEHCRRSRRRKKRMPKKYRHAAGRVYMPTLREDDVSQNDTHDPLFLSVRTENRERTRRHRHTALFLKKRCPLLCRRVGPRIQFPCIVATRYLLVPKTATCMPLPYTNCSSPL